MVFASPGDVAFTFFSLPIYYYGIVMSFAVFVGCFSAYYLFKIFYSPNDAEVVLNFSPLIIFAGILGARVYYCLLNLEYYLIHPLEIFNLRQGGLSVHGMLFIAIVAILFTALYKKISFWKLFDVFACGAAIGQSIGRWGNFFNSEAFGLPTNLPWKLYIPFSQRPVEFLGFDYFHPAFLYESILDFFLFLILILVLRCKHNSPGVTASVYLCLYSFVRLLVETIRIDSALSWGEIHVAHVASAFFLILGILFYFLLNKKSV